MLAQALRLFRSLGSSRLRHARSAASAPATNEICGSRIAPDDRVGGSRNRQRSEPAQRRPIRRGASQLVGELLRELGGIPEPIRIAVGEVVGSLDKDVFDDLGPFVPARFRNRPWAFARGVAAAVGVVVLLAGIVQADPFDGALRALAEAAWLVGFCVLGKPLGLRR